jgi:hypothetical protein
LTNIFAALFALPHVEIGWKLQEESPKDLFAEQSNNEN